MATYYRVYDSRHLQADCQEPGSAPEPYARQLSMGYLYLFYRPKGVGVVPLKCPFAMGNPGSALIHGSLNSRSIGSASNAGHMIVTNTQIHHVMPSSSTGTDLEIGELGGSGALTSYHNVRTLKKLEMVPKIRPTC